MEYAIDVTGIQQRDDVGMIEACRDLDLLEKPADG
jgi:hypothetical protein